MTIRKKYSKEFKFRCPATAHGFRGSMSQKGWPGSPDRSRETFSGPQSGTLHWIQLHLTKWLRVFFTILERSCETMQRLSFLWSSLWRLVSSRFPKKT